MDAKTLLEQKNIVTVSDLVALGVSRHKARHDLEDLVAAGVALKITEGKKVTYSLLLDAAEEPEHTIEIVSLAVGHPAAAVLAALRPGKALSVKNIAARSGVARHTVLSILPMLVQRGMAKRPFRRSERYLYVPA